MNRRVFRTSVAPENGARAAKGKHLKASVRQREPERLRLLMIIGACFLSMFSIHCRAGLNNDYTSSREKMVVEQIEARGVRDPGVLKAMRTVYRHQYVPDLLRHRAYDDSALPIGEGQTISQPYIVALMTEAISPQPDMKVLEIGTGSGYQAAILAELCKNVYTIEIVKTLAKRAESRLKKHYPNVHVRIGDGYQGWPEASPFDAILVTCAPTDIPQPLAAQLKEGGRMVIPVGGSGVQELYILTKKQGRLERQTIIPVLFVPMVDTKGKTY